MPSTTLGLYEYFPVKTQLQPYKEGISALISQMKELRFKEGR